MAFVIQQLEEQPQAKPSSDSLPPWVNMAMTYCHWSHIRRSKMGEYSEAEELTPKEQMTLDSALDVLNKYFRAGEALIPTVLMIETNRKERKDD